MKECKETEIKTPHRLFSSPRPGGLTANAIIKKARMNAYQLEISTLEFITNSFIRKNDADEYFILAKYREFVKRFESKPN